MKITENADGTKTLEGTAEELAAYYAKTPAGYLDLLKKMMGEQPKLEPCPHRPRWPWPQPYNPIWLYEPPYTDGSKFTITTTSTTASGFKMALEPLQALMGKRS